MSRPLRPLLALVPLLLAVPTPALEIVDPEGTPVAGARVELYAEPGGETPLALAGGTLFTGVSGEDGKVQDGEVPLTVPRIDGLLLVVDHPAFAPHAAPVAEAPPRRVTLARGARVEGRLRRPAAADRAAADHTAGAKPDGGVQRETGPQWETGTVCASWVSELTRWGRQRPWQRCADVHPDGGFVLPGLDPHSGEVALTAEAPGYLPATAVVAPGAGDVRLALAPGVLLQGTVTGDGEEPIPGARIRPEGGDGGDGGHGGDGHAAATDRRGRFRIAVARLPATLEIDADGYRPARLEVRDPADAGTLAVRLQPGQGVEGLLLDDQGQPVEHGFLWTDRFVPPSAWTPERHTLELTDGAFRVHLEPPALYRLRFQVEGFEDEVIPSLEVTAGRTVRLGAVTLHRGAGVEGRLVDAGDGLGQEGAALSLLPAGTSALDRLRRGALPRATSDEEGRFAFYGLEAGRYELRVRHRDYAATALPVEVDADRVTALGDVALDRGVVLEGRVVDRQGHPEADVTVALYPPSGEALEPLAAATTDGDGRFRTPPLTAGPYQTRVRRQRLLLSQRIDLPDGEERHDVELVVSGVRIEGEVVRDGRPVGGGYLTLHSDLDPGLRRGAVLVRTGGDLAAARRAYGVPDSQLWTPVDAGGRFTLDEVPAGAVTATHYGEAGETTVRRLLVPDRSTWRLRLDLSGRELSGRVIDPQRGAGVSAAVRLLDAAGREVARTRADADGRFLLANVETDVYVVEASAPGYARSSVDGVQPGAGPVVLELSEGEPGTLDVQLRRHDGSPAGTARVAVLSAAGDTVRALFTDPLGTRTYDGLSPGEYVVVWTDSRGGLGASPPLTLPPGDTRRFHHTLPPAAPLTLRCDPQLCAGRSVDGLSLFTDEGIEIGAFLPAVSTQMRFSENGELHLGHLSPDAYHLRLWMGGQRWDKPLRIAGGPAVVTFP